MRAWWRKWRAPVFLVIVAAVWWFGVRPITHDRGWTEVAQPFALCGDGGGKARNACVVDGDTLVIGFGRTRRRIRLTGFDAPELDAACEAERRAARTARTALSEWLMRGSFEWDGADDPPRDQFGRELRAVRRVTPGKRTELLADTMIERGLAAESGWGAEPVDWCGG